MLPVWAEFHLVALVGAIAGYALRPRVSSAILPIRVEEAARIEVDTLLEEMISAQRVRLLELARRIRPTTTAEDLLQPHDYPELSASSDFHFEDGILAGYLALRAALRARR